MSRRPEDHPGGGGDPTPDPIHRIGLTSPGVLVGAALVGLVAGWLVRPVWVRVTGTAPTVGWLPVLAHLFVVVLVSSTAWSTYRALRQDHRRLPPHHAVNRLVLAKACARAGALFAGGYFGYALSWAGLTETALVRERVVHSLAAGVCGVLMVVGSLLLERACRVDPEDREP